MQQAPDLKNTKPVEFVTEQESFNVYQLKDGNRLRVKFVVMQIRRLPNNPDGSPAYVFEHSAVTAVEEIGK